MTEYHHMTEDERAYQRRLWDLDQNQHYQGSEETGESSTRAPKIKSENSWDQNILDAWPPIGFGYDEQSEGGSQNTEPPYDLEETQDQLQGWNSPSERQYQESSRSKGKQKEQPQDLDGSEQNEPPAPGTGQQGSETRSERNHQNQSGNFNNRQEVPCNFEENSQEHDGQLELNQQWNDDLNPASPPKSPTSEHGFAPTTLADSLESPRPNNMEKYLPLLRNTFVEDFQTSQEREDFLEYSRNVMVMQEYNECLERRKLRNKVKGRETSIDKSAQDFRGSDTSDRETPKPGPSPSSKYPSNKRKRTYHEISDEEEEEEHQEENGSIDGNWRNRPGSLQKRLTGPDFEEWREKNLQFNPYHDYTPRRGESEPSNKRAKAHRGGRPARPTIDDPRWNIWTIGDPTLRLRGSNVSADYLRRVLFEDADCIGERRTKWSLPKLCIRLQQRREYRENEARRMGAEARPIGKPENWSPENPWWTYFEDV